MRIRLKVCCISSKEEARLAVRAGADALGLVGDMPSGPGIIGDELITEIAASVPPPVATFLLTSETESGRIAAHAAATGVSTIQIVDHIAPQDYASLRSATDGRRLVQVVHVESEETIPLALSYAGVADALLLDSGRPSAAVRELGGTGRTHNWEVSAEIVRKSSVPVFLAGGLNPLNIQDAVRAVKPYGVDLCSGVRTGTALDPEKLGAFVEALAAA